MGTGTLQAPGPQETPSCGTDQGRWRGRRRTRSEPARPAIIGPAAPFLRRPWKSPLQLREPAEVSSQSNRGADQPLRRLSRAAMEFITSSNVGGAPNVIPLIAPLSRASRSRISPEGKSLERPGLRRGEIELKNMRSWRTQSSPSAKSAAASATSEARSDVGKRFDASKLRPDLPPDEAAALCARDAAVYEARS